MSSFPSARDGFCDEIRYAVSIDPTRRTWLQLIGATALLGTAVSACNEVAETEVATAILEPTTTSFIVSVWASTAASVMIAIHTDGAMAQLLSLEIDADARVGALEVTGLTPDTRYDVTIATAQSAEPPPLVVRTAPAETEQRPVRVAIGADVDTSSEFDSPIFDALVRAEPELYISLGDFPYTDNGPIAETVDAYRERHQELRTLPKLRPLFEAMGVRAIYDDHEFRNDWNASFVASEGERYAAAMQVWDEFFPLGASGERRYRSWRWGAHLECFLLDCRRFRSANAAVDGAQKTMLGAEQLAWLVAGLRASTATFKLVLTSVPLDFGNGNDHWAAFRFERATLFDAVIDVPGVVFVSADQHWFAAHRHDHGIREFQVGPLARGVITPPEAVPGVVFRELAYNFGLVEASATTLTIAGVGADGTPFYKETLTVADLTPRRASQ